MLDETNVFRLFTETLTAYVEAVLADETGTMSANTARAGTLAVLARAGVPDRFVGHIEFSLA